ncbi:MAG: hypothetical protein COV36_03260 [Alphaproteobacteria bacterium CG11_big_fil_rev_8_21_14_0_20_44_7]|nr:MAG: hypothetical protein COV36_03260 [Alphaproteobacteria bacterium CG11_big_fil_rev_8_21_14_0_20_44_7]
MPKILLVIFLVLQFMFWSSTNQIKPNLSIMPPFPSKEEVAALSFGDDQMYFRILALQLQMMGDTFGRTTPLKDYDYPLLNKWFLLLDTLDWESNFVPSIAAYYFSRTQHPPDVVYVVDYLEKHSMVNPEKKWWWLSQAIYLTNSVLGDKERALKYGRVLRKVKTTIPMWARQMEVFLREDLGENEEAETVMCEIFENAADIPEFEMNFMLYFFEERLKTVNDANLEEIAKRCAMISMMEERRSRIEQEYNLDDDSLDGHLDNIPQDNLHL